MLYLDLAVANTPKDEGEPFRVYAVLVTQLVGKGHLRVKIVNGKARGEYHEIGCTGHLTGGPAGMGGTIKNKQVELLRSGQSGADTREGSSVNFRSDLVCSSALVPMVAGGLLHVHISDVDEPSVVSELAANQAGRCYFSQRRPFVRRRLL